MITALDGQTLASLGNHLVDKQQEAARLWRQLIQRAPQRFMRQRVCRGDVVHCSFDVLHYLAVMTDALRGSLVLMQECNASDEREVLEMISPGPGLIIEEGKLTSEGIRHVHRTQQPLRVAMHGQKVVPVSFGKQAFERLPLTLETMNGPGLLPILING